MPRWTNKRAVSGWSSNFRRSRSHCSDEQRLSTHSRGFLGSPEFKINHQTACSHSHFFDYEEKH
jgi:hypothetical protein